MKSAGEALAGRVVIDVTNALDASMGLAIGFTTSGAEDLAEEVAEPLAFFNIQLGYVQKMGTQIGFKLLHG